MGQTATSLARTATKPVSWLFGRSGSDNEINSHCSGLVPSFGASLYIYKRRGSMYFDEDGDLAHEFYKQVVRGSRLTMERCLENLRPQGDVDLPIPRLNGDLPVIMYEVPSTIVQSTRPCSRWYITVQLLLSQPSFLGWTVCWNAFNITRCVLKKQFVNVIHHCEDLENHLSNEDRSCSMLNKWWTGECVLVYGTAEFSASGHIGNEHLPGGVNIGIVNIFLCCLCLVLMTTTPCEFCEVLESTPQKAPAY